MMVPRFIQVNRHPDSSHNAQDTPCWVAGDAFRAMLRRSAAPSRLRTPIMGSSGTLLPELLGEPDENSFGAPDVAEPIHVFVLDHFANELRTAFAEPDERIVDVLHGEHDA
jgi:hypothetical protein